MGASGSLLTATMTFESLIPAKCCMAPETPNAIYKSGATIFPVWPTWEKLGLVLILKIKWEDSFKVIKNIKFMYLKKKVLLRRMAIAHNSEYLMQVENDRSKQNYFSRVSITTEKRTDKRS